MIKTLEHIIEQNEGRYFVKATLNLATFFHFLFIRSKPKLLHSFHVKDRQYAITFINKSFGCYRPYAYFLVGGNGSDADGDDRNFTPKGAVWGFEIGSLNYVHYFENYGTDLIDRRAFVNFYRLLEWRAAERGCRKLLVYLEPHLVNRAKREGFECAATQGRGRHVSMYKDLVYPPLS